MQSSSISGNHVIDEDVRRILSSNVDWFSFDNATIVGLHPKSKTL